MKIISIKKGSQAASKGLKPGDKVVEINKCPVRDYIDLMYYGSEENVRLTVHRGSYEFHIGFRGEEDFGIEFEPMKIQTCANNCVFCFVDQNPPGMREAVYIKDEDYRLSFLHGAYVTLSHLGKIDLQRIVAQRLSPLYISVHATDLETRMKLLGIQHDDHFIENMEHLLTAGIQLHCQIVVCPGINNGCGLEKTVIDLRRMSRNILSVAVVPVGLTKHRLGLNPLTGVDEEAARGIVDIVDRLHYQFMEETGEGFVFCADELYIRTGFEIPGADYYQDFPQIENGVGMARDFLDAVADIKGRLGGKLKRSGKFVFVTGLSMASYIEDLAQQLSLIPGLQVRVVAVKNRFYGDSVTVSGLLTGNDILSALGGIQPEETVVLPPNCLNEPGLFLDDLAPAVMAETLGTKVIQGDYDPLKIFL